MDVVDRRSIGSFPSILSKTASRISAGARKAARSPRTRELSQALILFLFSLLLGAWAWTHSREEGFREGGKKSRPAREAWEKVMRAEGLVPREDAHLEHRLQGEGLPLPPGAASAAWLETSSRWVVFRSAEEGIGRVLWLYGPTDAKRTTVPFQKWISLGEDGPGLFHLVSALEKSRAKQAGAPQKSTVILRDPREVSY